MVAIRITDRVEVDVLTNWDVHPAAELFPLMEGREFQELLADMLAYGQRDPVVLTPDGQLLDGRNRVRALDQLGVAPVTRVEDAEPWAYVLSTNMHRRHLTEPQRAMIAARIAERHHGQRGAGQKREPHAAIFSDLPPTQKQVSELLNVGRTSVKAGRTVLQFGTESLAEAVTAGKVPVSTAARVAEQPVKEQETFVRRVEAGEDPSKLAPPRRPAREGAPPVPITGRTAATRRHLYVTAETLETINGAMRGLDLVVRGATEGFDPSLTKEEAARWAGDLSKGRAVVSRVIKMLERHQESSS